MSQELTIDEKDKLLDFFAKNSEDFINRLFYFMEDNKVIKDKTKPFDVILNQISSFIFDWMQNLKELSENIELEKIKGLVLCAIKNSIEENIKDINNENGI